MTSPRDPHGGYRPLHLVRGDGGDPGPPSPAADGRGEGRRTDPGAGRPPRELPSPPAERRLLPARLEIRLPSMAADRVEARARHPAGRRWLPDRARLLQRLAERAQDGGAPWPRVAAAVLALRGIAGDDGPTFARRLGISTTALARLEAGASPASAVPPRLRAVGGLVDWKWVDAGEVDR
jgi:hypothetical protein